jgi:hypothetical protein
MYLSFLRYFSIGTRNTVTAEDLLPVLGTLLDNATKLHSSVEDMPWDYILLFTQCGKFNYGLLEFLNHPEFSETLDKVQEFLEKQGELEMEKLNEKEQLGEFSKLSRVINFIFFCHLLDFKVNTELREKKAETFLNKSEYEEIYQKVLQATMTLLIFCDKLNPGILIRPKELPATENLTRSPETEDRGCLVPLLRFPG